MRLWHEATWDYLPLQWQLSISKEIAMAIRSNMLGHKHSTVQYALDDDVEKLIAYRLKFYDFVVDNDIFNIDDRAGAYNYINSKVGFSSEIDIEKVKYWYNQENIYEHHNEEYFIECLDNLWGKMTGDIKRYNGEDYNDKNKKMLWKMFSEKLAWVY